MKISASILNERVDFKTLDRELERAGMPHAFFVAYPDRDFDDLPTVAELIEFIRARPSPAADAWVAEWNSLTN